MQSNIQTVITGWVLIMDVAESIKLIYSTTANAMDAVEAQGGIKDGRSKKEWVLAFIKNTFNIVGNDWENWYKLLSTFIDKAKTLYNYVLKLNN